MVSDNYFLFHKSIPLIIFGFDVTDVISAYIQESSYEHLPLPLKPLLVLKDNYGVYISEGILELNEEGCGLLEMWLSSREIPTIRNNLNEKLDTTELMFEEHACSFTDCYWICKTSDTILEWDDAKLYASNNVGSYQVAATDKQKFYKGANATLGGQLEKFWYYETKHNTQTIKLCKRVKKTMGILAAREAWAYHIYKALGVDAVPYELLFNSQNNVVGCKCDAFTSEKLELITASDLLEEQHLMASDTDAYEDIIRCAVAYGANEAEVKQFLSAQIMVDYLITNRDRHLGNFGFLRDSDTLQIIKPAQIFDSGSSEQLEGELPEGVEMTTVNGCYKTEKECLNRIPDWSAIDLSKVPTDLSWLSQLNLELTDARKERIADLFHEKLQYLQKLQKAHLNAVPSKINI